MPARVVTDCAPQQRNRAAVAGVNVVIDIVARGSMSLLSPARDWSRAQAPA
jgi:hypothetical protein